ncbi:MAG: hypothetical protein HYZ53_10625 [Planctomycetes bacterium]|nr:hypothetical protein [Planctomycetota bacterium]
MPRPRFHSVLHLPHAATLSGRLAYQVDRACTQRRAEGQEFSAPELPANLERLGDLLAPYRLREEAVPPAEAAPVVEEAARLGRAIVDEVERLGLGDDRLGQVVRNLFECLGLGEEGFRISLRAGEDPNSLGRPF